MDEEAVLTAFDPETREAFERRVAAQADRVRADLLAGRLDADCFAVGLELEAYAVDADGRLAEVPEAVFEEAGCAGELGLHNVEVNTRATRFDADGLAAQREEARERVERVRSALAARERSLALDAMWTIPPAGGSEAYLNATRSTGDLTVPANARPNARYYALDEEVRRRAGGAVDIDLPGASLTCENILVESLTTSMQPHLQVPRAAAFPRYHDLAVRTMAPVLALATNSPFLPADLYAGADPDVVEATGHELRIPVFEESINAGRPPGEGNVRVPEDVDDVTEVVDRVVADPTYAPSVGDEVEHGTSDLYREDIPEFDAKRGVHWRWVRGVIGGQPVGTDDGGALRLEYRPIPTQPTVDDVVSVQALVVGLLRGLVATDHPLGDLPWADARDAFYDVVRRGPAADLAWVTADGERTGDPERIYDDVFAVARRGLAEAGVDEATADAYLDPVERRRASGPPSAWKKAQARTALAEGASVPEAVERAQRAYLARAGGEPSADWPRP
ncbi:MAG: hypothetical protein ABEJ61_03800 [Haloferacaceae archaeon]